MIDSNIVNKILEKRYDNGELDMINSYVYHIKTMCEVADILDEKYPGEGLKIAAVAGIISELESLRFSIEEMGDKQ